MLSSKISATGMLRPSDHHVVVPDLVVVLPHQRGKVSGDLRLRAFLSGNGK